MERRGIARNGLNGFRRSRGLMAGYVCRQIGINPVTLRRWETAGKEPSQVGYMALASLFGVTVDELKEVASNASNSRPEAASQ